MKHFTIAANWKMHLDPGQARRLVERLQGKVAPHTHVTNVLCAPFVDLPAVKTAVEPDKFKIGAQNLHEKDEGTYTGEISGLMLKGLADYVIVGHSERRRFFHETEQQVAAKVAAALRNGLKPILCVGENLRDRHEGHQRRVVNDQLQSGLREVAASDLENLLITYEPLWAISSGDGKGHFASPDDVDEMLGVIRQSVEEIFGEGASGRVKQLYGGSVNPDDCKAYLQLENVDGLLVGGASLNYEEFAEIIKTAQGLADKKA